MKIDKRIINGFLVLAGLLVLAINLQAQVLFYEGFESGDLSKWKKHVDGKTPLIELITEDTRSGTYAVRFKTKGENGDRRSELIPLVERFNWGTEYWVSFSFRIIEPCGKAGIVYQNHSVPGENNWKCNAGANSLTIKANSSEELTYLTSTVDSLVNKRPLDGGATKGCEATNIKYSFEDWQDIVINFFYSPDSLGFVKVWQNGVVILDDKGPNVYQIDKCGKVKTPQQYMKIGLYPAVKGADGEVLYDEIRVVEGMSGYEQMRPAKD